MTLTLLFAASASVVLGAFGLREMILATTDPFIEWKGMEFTIHMDAAAREPFLARFAVVIHGAWIVWHSRSFEVTAQLVQDGVRYPERPLGWWRAMATVLFRPHRVQHLPVEGRS